MVQVNPAAIGLRRVVASTLALLLCLTSGFNGYGQCQNTALFPTAPIVASAFSDTVVVAVNSYAGDYFRVNSLSLNRTYTLLSSNTGDFFTVRNANTNAVIAQGTTPLTYNVGSGPDVVDVHLNLAVGCGIQTTARVTRIVCSTCPPPAGRVGVNTTSPRATLDVGGEIRLGNAQRPAEAGMVRWNPATNDFEGYNGTTWLSLTKSNTATGQWGNVAASNIQENNKITASDGAANDNFGYSVSISGDYAIVGAFLDDFAANTDQGSAYIFVRNGTNWTQQAKLTASDGVQNDQFGISVSINGDYAIVGARFSDIGGVSSQGAAYVFIRNGVNWTQQTKLIASDGAEIDFFGSSVSLNGNYAIVGSPGSNVGVNDSQGAAYVFLRNGTTWSQQAKLTASDGGFADGLGNSVSISGNYAIVGASGASIGTNSSQGTAYIFFHNGVNWTQQAKLIASDGAAFDDFGKSVSINGDYAIVGSNSDDIGANSNQGSAYVFVRSGTVWTQQAKLTAADGAADDGFGFSVSINGNYAIVGALSDDIGAIANQGSAYVFVRSGNIWTQQAKLTASDGTTSDQFGFSVNISDNYAIVGSLFDSVLTNASQGSAYIIQRN